MTFKITIAFEIEGEFKDPKEFFDYLHNEFSNDHENFENFKMEILN